MGDRDFTLYMLLYDMNFLPYEYKVEITIFEITKNRAMWNIYIKIIKWTLYKKSVDI